MAPSVCLVRGATVGFIPTLTHVRVVFLTTIRMFQAVRTINAALPEGEGDLHVLKAAGKGVKECMKKFVGLDYQLFA